jgi:hypothetical protein
MEHLMLDGRVPPIVIPYIARDDFNDGDFSTFPERKGWDISTWRWSTKDVGFDLNGRSIQEMSSFLQEWLFFGLLGAVLDIVIVKGDFLRSDVDGRRYLTTAALPNYLQDWKERFDKFGRPEQDMRTNTAFRYWTEAQNVNCMLTYLLIYGDDIDGSESLKETLFAQMLLTEALEGTTKKILWDHDEDPFPQEDTLLRERMIASGWCPFTVKYMQDKLPLQEQAFAFSLGSTRASQDHSACEDELATGCTLGRVDENFKPVHVNENCTCEMISPSTEKVVSVLEDGFIPLIMIVRAKDDPERLELLVKGVELLPLKEYDAYPYFAVSHVWSDGLGNPQGNALPHCQLLRLERITKSIGSDTRVRIIGTEHGTTAHQYDPVALWLDTLCIPVQPRYQALRDFSIQKMREIYSKARGVLVLDPNIQQIASTTRPVEVLSRTMTSDWMSRLWTFQEGMLARELLFPGLNCCFTLNSEEELLIKDDNNRSNLVERLLIGNLWWKYIDQTFDVTTKTNVTQDELEAGHFLLKAIVHRRTTRPGDETICIATFLGIDPTPLLAATVEERMPILMTLWKAIPPHVLFTRGTRLDVPGFRWAPRSFLSPFGLRDVDEVYFPLTYTPDAKDPEILHPMPRPSLHAQQLGLVCFFSALLVRAPYRGVEPIPEVFSIRTFDSLRSDTTWLVDARETGSDIFWDSIISPKSSLAILLSRPESVANTPGLLVEIINDVTNDNGEVLVKWRSLVIVHNVGEIVQTAMVEEGKAFLLEGEFVPFRWWVVD